MHALVGTASLHESSQIAVVMVLDLNITATYMHVLELLF